MLEKKKIYSLKEFRRILIKISGEALSGSSVESVDLSFLQNLAQQIAVLSEKYEIALVIGGGNFFRGISLSNSGFCRQSGDSIGMLATVINALMFQEVLSQYSVVAQVFSGISVKGVTAHFNHRECEHYFGSKKVAIFAGGIGQPYFTTDMAAVLWGLKCGCEVVMKATKVDGVYSTDPLKNPEAQFFSYLTYSEALEKKCGVMDLSALALASENNLPLVVFNVQRAQSIKAVMNEEIPFTWVL